jgi:formate dehydrogenase major subunit
MTNNWVDIRNANLVLIMGGNAAEAHPCGFKWVTEAKAHNKARLIVVDPRFNRSAAVADFYAPIRAGSDIAFLGGVINYLLAHDLIQHEYVKAYTDASFIVRADYDFKDGLFSGYDTKTRKYNTATWMYELDEHGYAKVDPTLKHERCVLNLLREHYSRYTPEVVSRVTGTPKQDFLKICGMIGETAAPDKTLTMLYALGWTQHSQGTQMIRCAAMVQTLLGNVGMAGGGMNALRGHSNIQGLTDLGLLSNLLPGYLTLPGEKEADYAAYIQKRTPKPLRPNQLNYWSNYSKFHVSLMKAWFGKAATPDNDWCYDWLPKLDKQHDVLQVFEDMFQGRINGYVCQGFNALAAFPNKQKLLTGLSKLKYLVVIDPLATETSEFWSNFGAYNDVDPSKIQTEVIRLPSTCFAEEDGSLVNSGRWLQWHWKGADPPGEAKADTEILGGLFTKLRGLYREEGGAFPDPILNLTWDYSVADAPSPEELAKEFNGKALADVPDPKDPKKQTWLAKAGEQLDSFAQLQDDGSTSCGCWIFSGAWTSKGNMMARRDNSDPSRLGCTPGWAFSWPANRRILYNRASADPAGKPWDPKRKVVAWNGQKWTGVDVPDIKVDAPPESGMNPFIMNADGVAHLFALDKLVEGPFPEHYEPVETPLPSNPMHPDNPLVKYNPVCRLFEEDAAAIGDVKDYPYVGTTYRLTEHFHFWTKHTRIGAVLQPEQFVEIGEDLAKDKGILHGDRVKVRSKRGEITAVAVVTKRLRPLEVEGKLLHTVGIPLHWGFKGVARPGYITNTLTPFVGDANTNTPEFKAFLVNVEKA